MAVLHLRNLLAAWLMSGGVALAGVPQPGASAPDFSLPDHNGQLIRLSDLRGQWVVLYFYPRDETPHCTAQACRLRDDHSRLTELGARVLGVSVDSQASHTRFAQRHGLPFSLLSDETGAVARSYGSLRDWWLIRFARRNTFLIDPAGQIDRVWTGVDVDHHAQDVLEALRAAKGVR